MGRFFLGRGNSICKGSEEEGTHFSIRMTFKNVWLEGKEPEELERQAGVRSCRTLRA